jgi:hypothetical protein
MKRLIVTGTPGAWFHAVNRKLLADGWAVTWPGQDLDIVNARRFFEANWNNIEVYNIIQQICINHNIPLWSDNLPRFYDIPYPGPKEFVAKFDGPMLISSIYLSAFLDIWAPFCTTVIDVQALEADDLQTLKVWTGQKLDDVKLKSIRAHHLSRYTEHLKLFSRVFTMTNADVKANRFDELNQFLGVAF